MLSWFKQALSELDLTISETQSQQFQTYYEMLEAANAVMNLTAITGEEAVYRKHFLDSLCLSKATSLIGKTLLDVGSGAGFPAIPLKIMHPDLDVTIIDATGKRVKFLNSVIEALGLKGIKTILGRAEEYDAKNSYDLVTARAVAKMDMLCELCLPFVKVGGLFIAMKSIDSGAEIVDAYRAIRLIGGTYSNTVTYRLDEEFEHTLVVITKIQPTGDKYPRSFAQIKAKPL